MNIGDSERGHADQRLRTQWQVDNPKHVVLSSVACCMSSVGSPSPPPLASGGNGMMASRVRRFLVRRSQRAMRSAVSRIGATATYVLVRRNHSRNRCHGASSCGVLACSLLGTASLVAGMAIRVAWRQPARRDVTRRDARCSQWRLRWRLGSRPLEHAPSRQRAFDCGHKNKLTSLAMPACRAAVKESRGTLFGQTSTTAPNAPTRARLSSTALARRGQLLRPTARAK